MERVMAKKTNSPLRGSIVLITGGGRGVGRLIALRLASEGAVVALAARSPDELEDVAVQIRKTGGSVVTFVADVTDLVAVRRMVESIENETGPIDVLINNAGIVGPIGNTWDCAWDAWWRTIEINLGGTMAFSKAVIPAMTARRRGRIVNMVSHAGAFRWPTVSAYSVSKAALIRFSENLALECHPFGLNVFAYHPGMLPLGMTSAAAALQASSQPAEARVGNWCLAQLESDKLASPDEAVTRLVQLLSGEYDDLSGRYITVGDDLDTLVKRVRDRKGHDDYLMLRPQR
jgi:NAD(P)-dependent dehydrogenase (short-subunit alcohol dehydrogenase family)